MAESFFATLETELFWAQPGRRQPPRSQAGDLRLRRGLLQPPRRHTSIGGISPIAYENLATDQVVLAA